MKKSCSRKPKKTVMVKETKDKEVQTDWDDGEDYDYEEIVLKKGKEVRCIAEFMKEDGDKAKVTTRGTMKKRKRNDVSSLIEKADEYYKQDDPRK